jgi:hypothetical protein
LGLLASYDVGIFGGQIRAVIEAIPAECPVTKAGVAIPHLPALYQDDLADAAEYANITRFMETSAAFAGYGLSLCHNYESKRHASRRSRK